MWAGSEIQGGTGNVTTTEFTISSPAVGITHSAIPAPVSRIVTAEPRLVINPQGTAMKTGVFDPGTKRVYSLRGELQAGSLK